MSFLAFVHTFERVVTRNFLVAMPQLMRPKLHVLGVVSGDSTDSEAPAVPTPEVVESPAVTVAVGTPLVAAASSVRPH